MGHYLLLLRPRGRIAEAGDRLRAAIEDSGEWTLAVGLYQLAVYVRGPRPPSVRVMPHEAGVVIGELYDSQAARDGAARDFDLAALEDGDRIEMARDLTERAWGRYVAVLKHRDDPPYIYRDPMGALECLTWERDGVTVVASEVEAGRPWSPEHLAIDEAALGQLLADHARWSEICPLHGVVAVAPGVLRHGPDARESERLWSPARMTHQSVQDRDPAALTRVVDGCVAALARDRKAILVEISGGLDSAIVAASLARCGAPVVAGINYYWPEPEGDERVWAQRIADRCGFKLIASRREVMVLDGVKLARHALAPRPGLNAQDPDLDHDIAEQAKALGADALISGQGGDAVFFQMAHLALTSEILCSKAPLGARIHDLTVLARRARTTIWSLLARSMKPLLKSSPPVPPPGFLAQGLERCGAHAWIEDRQGVSRAKRIQIRAITNCQNAFGDSLRGQAADLLYPLMAQPVVEHCLGIDAPLLAIGEVDRPFARAAFADRLPPESLTRRAKGDVTVFFSKSLAASLPGLRPYLLDGRLAGRGMIDPARLEPLLHPEPMIWRDCVGEVMLAAYAEAWVRAWEQRLGS